VPSGTARPGRTALTAVVASLLFTACTGGSDDPSPPDDTPVLEPGAKVIAEFAVAWPEATATSLRGIVDRPAVAAEDIASRVAELDITATRVTPTGEPDCDDESCREQAKVTHDLAGAQEWSYQTEITSRLTGRQPEWLVEWRPGIFHPDLTESTTLVRQRTLPPRAPILDRNGVALTPEREIVRVGVVPRLVRPLTYTRLSDLLGVATVPLRDRVTAAQPDWFVSVIDLRSKDYEPLREDLLRVPGISIDTARRALAPSAEWGRAVLGTVGPATSETLETAGPYALATDEVGTAGLQLAYQQRLAGVPGLTVDLVEQGPQGDVLNHVFLRRPQPGQPLETTLDLAAQDAAENAVAGATDVTAAVAVKASTGEILAAANAPGPTTYNTAFIGRYAPGSTFKVVSAAALLGKGLVKPDMTVRCPDTTVVGGKSFKNYDPGIVSGEATFADAFAASCNTTFVSFADRISGAELASTSAEFGLGSQWDIGLDGFSGLVPAHADLVTRAADLIGQGHVEASPLAMAMVAAAVDSGVSRTPTLLPGVLPGNRLTELDPTTVTQLQQMMRRTVTSGTAIRVDLPGAQVHAKTGTAEYADDGGTGTNAWMIGYRGDLAFAVLVENGASGAHDASPVVKALLESIPRRLYR
jgi:cell division protein FtsI/penicillin-binding protein 2